MSDEDEIITGGEPVTRGVQDAATAGDGRHIDVRLAAWGDVATQTAEGIHETIARGAFAGTDPARVILESTRHDGSIVGVAESIIERDDGAYATFRVASTPAGDELLTLTRDGILGDASIVAQPVTSRRLKSGVIERTALDLRRVAILARGAYPSAKVLAVRHEETPVSDTALIERVAAQDDRLAKVEALVTIPSLKAPSPVPYADLGAYARAVYAGEADPDLIYRTLSDQITSQNDGMAQTGWLTDVKRIVNLGRRAISSFGGPAALPSHGMTVTWPFLTSSNTIIGAQSTQKSEVTSARVDIDDGTATVATYAGGSDISVQLLQRGDPDYLAAYQRIMLAAWATITDAAFVTGLEAGTVTNTARMVLGSDLALTTSAASDDIIDFTPDHGLAAGDAVVFTALTGGTGLTAGRVYWVVATSLAAKSIRVASTPGGAAIGFSADITAGTLAKVTDTGAKFRQSLFECSVAVEDATGRPAEVVLASTDVFLALAGMSSFVNPSPSTNASNAAGLSEASTLRMESSGLTVVRTPGVTAGKWIVSNRLAAQWMEDGPRWLMADDVAKLGRDVAVYSFGAPAVFVPAGVVEVTFI